MSGVVDEQPEKPKGNAKARRKAKRVGLQKTKRLPSGRLLRQKRLASGFIFGSKKLRKLALKIDRQERVKAIEVLAKTPKPIEEERPQPVEKEGWKDYRSSAKK